MFSSATCWALCMVTVSRTPWTKTNINKTNFSSGKSESPQFFCALFPGPFWFWAGGSPLDSLSLSLSFLSQPLSPSLSVFSVPNPLPAPVFLSHTVWWKLQDSSVTRLYLQNKRCEFTNYSQRKLQLWHDFTVCNVSTEKRLYLMPRNKYLSISTLIQSPSSVLMVNESTPILRDVHAARAAYSMGDINGSREAHVNKVILLLVIVYLEASKLQRLWLSLSRWSHRERPMIYLEATSRQLSLGV